MGNNILQVDSGCRTERNSVKGFDSDCDLDSTTDEIASYLVRYVDLEVPSNQLFFICYFPDLELIVLTCIMEFSPVHRHSDLPTLSYSKYQLRRIIQN